MANLKKNILSEDQIRTFVRCPRLFNANETIAWSAEDLATKQVLEAFFYAWSSSQEPPIQSVNQIVGRVIHQYSKKQKIPIDTCIPFSNHLVLMCGDILRLFPANHYIPIFGPFLYNFVVGASTVQLQVVGILKSNHANTLHFISFYPVARKHTLMNDPINFMKAMAFQDLRTSILPATYHGNGTLLQEVVCHNIAIHNSVSDCLVHHYITDNELHDYDVENYETLLKAIEIGYRQPSLPCPYSECQLRSTCFPDTGRDTYVRKDAKKAEKQAIGRHTTRKR